MRIELPGNVAIFTEHVIMERQVPGAQHEPPGLELTTNCPMFQPAQIQVGNGMQLTFNIGAMVIKLTAEQAAAYRNALSRGGTTMGVKPT